MIIDTSALLAYFDTNEPEHAGGRGHRRRPGPFIVSPYVVAELDYLLLTRHGPTVEHSVIAELSGGGWELGQMDRDRLGAATTVVRRYPDVPIGIADASNIVLAQAYRTRDIATLDHRHFSILRFDDGSAPRILPH